MISKRSSSDSPPQIPYGSWTARAWARQAAITGHWAQTAFAAFSRPSRRGPRSPSGWKNISVGRERHAAWYCHSQAAATGLGRREVSAIARKIQARHKLFKYPSITIGWAWRERGLGCSALIFKMRLPLPTPTIRLWRRPKSSSQLPPSRAG